MSFRRLILTILAAISLLLPTSVLAAESGSRMEEASINRTDDRPQWQDVKMRDVLAVTSSSTLTPPTTVRVVHDSPAGTAPATQAANTRHYSIQRLSAYKHCRTVSGYIYLIRCLRL